MWIQAVVFYGFFLTTSWCHIPDYASTPKSRVDQYCNLAESCIHDTIPICGRMNEEKRTFLDHCDLLEYACDTSFVFTHVDDMPGCPAKAEK